MDNFAIGEVYKSPLVVEFYELSFACDLTSLLQLKQLKFARHFIFTVRMYAFTILQIFLPAVKPSSNFISKILIY